MTTTDGSEFPAIARATEVLDKLDDHRQRQVFAFLAERYGWNLQPTAKKIMLTPSRNNALEFPTLQEAAELLDELTADQQRQSVALIAARYNCKVAAAYKPPARGFGPKRKYTKG
jgi:hypothetical protein